ncbi:MAG: LysM peptidoglycan-binding domain-containing protein [Muribaculaceae bacterium]|nr:LysM peptidoglycan-binding domain-containing protein [Muribaculaceae bacterium]
MNKLLRIAVGLILAASPINSIDAAVKDLPVKTVNGHMYHYYKVPGKETVYSVCYKLGVTKEELIRYNPAVEDGLKVGMTIYFPYEGDPDRKSAEEGVTHHVEKGETIFGISHKYGISEQQLMEQNPFLKNGLKAGQTLVIKKAAEPTPPVTNTPPAPQVLDDDIEMVGYIVKKKETLYSIAVAHGITVAELEAANPGLVSLQAGQVLSIPVRKPKSEADNPKPIGETTEPQQSASTATTELTADSTRAEVSEVSIAVILPFMLEEETPSKSAQRYTEFYKGLLLAVDSLRTTKAPIHVSTFDSEGSVVKMREIIENPDFKRHNAIIAPDNAAQLAILAEYGKNNNVKVLNSFVIRDESYLTNPAMIQGNLPSALMYKKAVSALVERLRHSTPVFYSVKDVTSDKKEFVTELKEALTAEGIAYTEIETESALTPTDLASLQPDGNYTFIPTSSRQADLNKLMPGLIEWRDKEVTPLVRLFGYPEWTMFRGETLSNMHNLNTTVYSRFFADYDDTRSDALENKFKFWYGTGMESAVPRQGLMGFDAGMFLIPYVTDGTLRYDGIQNGYRIVPAADGGGFYNDMLYFITFRPGEKVDKTPL